MLAVSDLALIMLAADGLLRILANDGNGLGRRDVESGSPVGFVGDGSIEILFNKLLSPREFVAPAHGEDYGRLGGRESETSNSHRFSRAWLLDPPKLREVGELILLRERKVDACGSVNSGASPTNVMAAGAGHHIGYNSRAINRKHSRKRKRPAHLRYTWFSENAQE